MKKEIEIAGTTTEEDRLLMSAAIIATEEKKLIRRPPKDSAYLNVKMDGIKKLILVKPNGKSQLFCWAFGVLPDEEEMISKAKKIGQYLAKKNYPESEKIETDLLFFEKILDAPCFVMEIDSGINNPELTIIFYYR